MRNLIENLEGQLAEEYNPSKSKALARNAVPLAKEMVSLADDEEAFMAKAFMLLGEIEEIMLVSGPKYKKATNALTRAKSALSAIPVVDLGLKKAGW